MHYLGPLCDLPLPHTGRRLRTRRRPLAQIVLCQGCCCGQTSRGLPAVPLDWLKPLWKSEKLNTVVQLTVSGCLGPCDLPNVCCINTPTEQVWYGRLTTREDYAVLVAWAQRCRDQGQLLPLPAELEHLRFSPWPGEDETGSFVLIAQEPADIVLLTAADTELLTWSAAVAHLPAGFPSVRALNLDRLRDRRALDSYLDDVLQECRVVVLRVLGGLGYWREQLEEIHLLARAHGIALCVLPGDSGLDPELAALCTVPLPIADRVLHYCCAGGVDNAAALLRYLSDTFLGTTFGHELPRPLPETGIYHPDHAQLLDRQTWRAHSRPDAPTVGVAFYRAHWVTGNLAPVDALVRALEQRGLNVLAVFAPHLGAALPLVAGVVDVLITTTSFSAGAADLASLDVPVLQAIFCGSSENVWAANLAGLTPRDLAMNVALPEFDGRLITTAVSFKTTLTHDTALQTEVVRYVPRPDRVAHVADLARNWARLRHTPAAQRKVAILLANYPSKNARVGNAVGLDTPASLHALLLALSGAGYDIGPSLPPDGQALIEALIAASVQDTEFATAEAHTHSPGWVSVDQYRAWFEDLPREARERMVSRWGGPEQSPQFHSGGFPVPGLLLGNVFVGIQPARGYDQDPAAVYHSPDLPPPPYYLAFYRWVRDTFVAHAVVHLGKHGNLEWLPGKGSALSAACYPEAILRDLPNIYPYIINNPGEGTQAKRRSAAVIVDHLIPPMTQAGTYGALRRLELLLDEYYTVQSLDPSKAPLLLEEIGRLIEEQHVHRDLDCDAPTAEGLPAFLRRLDGYLCEIKEAQIRDGLHVLGQVPEGDQLTELMVALVRLDNGAVPGLVKALALDLSMDHEALTRDPAAAPLLLDPVRTVLAGSNGDAALRTCGDVMEALGGLARRLVREGVEGDRICADQLAQTGGPLEHTQQTLRYLRETVWPHVQQCRQEIDHVLAALDGRFVPPGPSGAPTRGTADVLPTGRNFYSLDIRAVPTPTAWRVGCAAADALLRRHIERTGGYPESVALVVWGTSNMRTGGDDIAEVLALLGVRPRWDEANRRVLGVEAISLAELGRPRIDVTVRISGLFRDAFPNLVKLLNDAVALAARLEEPLDHNFVRAHIARDTALLARDPKAALSAEEAARRASLRVFGSKPGAYGAGLLPLIDARNWQTVEDLAEVYLTWGSYAYTGTEQDGREERAAFRLRLEQTEVVAQNQDNREHDLFDSDDYFQFHGGMIAAVRALTGTAPAAYLGDTSRPDAVRTRTLREEACRVFRARVVNPRWLEGVMRHGYKGAVEMAATVDYLFGYDATAEVIDDWMYEQLTAAYLFDERVSAFLRRANPWAERAMVERLLEAAARGLWEQPDPETLSRLEALYRDNDAWLEGRP
ncbi:MAG: cobaltochelatase subunit CobN [Gemmataceae bacterium]|nr:cobaltochelatase subunit CobN [Gemmataceae bacterium]